MQVAGRHTARLAVKPAVAACSGAAAASPQLSPDCLCDINTHNQQQQIEVSNNSSTDTDSVDNGSQVMIHSSSNHSSDNSGGVDNNNGDNVPDDKDWLFSTLWIGCTGAFQPCTSGLSAA